MAAQVLTGTTSFTYTNNTGQNVRLIVYYLETSSSGNPAVTFNGSGMGAVNIPKSSRIGKYVAAHNDQGTYGNNHANEGGYNTRFAFPCEFVMANGDSFSSNGVVKYNVLVIPEGG